MIKKLEALETWFYRRMLRISWKEKVTNVEVNCCINTSTSLLIDIVTGFVDGKQYRGRKRETFLTYLSKIVGKSPLELINLAKKGDA